MSLFFTEVTEVITTDKHVVLKNLKPLTTYKAFIMVSTSGGSMNGSVASLETGSVGELTYSSSKTLETLGSFLYPKIQRELK